MAADMLVDKVSLMNHTIVRFWRPLEDSYKVYIIKTHF